MNKASSASTSPRWLRRLGRRIARTFLHGVLIVAPIAITLALVHWIFVKVDGLLRPWVNLPGVGFLAILAGILLIGWIASFFLIDRLFALIDRWLDRLPGVNFIYTSVRDFFNAFVGRKRRFQQTVLVNVFARDVWLLGFLTDEHASLFDLGADHVAVYVPQAYNVAGQLYLVPRERIRPVEDLAPADAMKYAVTGGAVDIAPTK